MLYANITEEFLDDVILNYNLTAEFGDGLVEVGGILEDDKLGNIKMHFLFNGIRRAQHGLRIKVMDVAGKKGFEFPINTDTGALTFDKKLVADVKIGKSVAKIIAGFAKENLDLLNKYYGYRDKNNKLIDGDASVEADLKNAIDSYNNKSKSEKEFLITKGVIDAK